MRMAFPQHCSLNYQDIGKLLNCKLVVAQLSICYSNAMHNLCCVRMALSKRFLVDGQLLAELRNGEVVFALG